jgi:hypothetical protein
LLYFVAKETGLGGEPLVLDTQGGWASAMLSEVKQGSRIVAEQKQRPQTIATV